jgi:exonuclease VII small subunit
VENAKKKINALGIARLAYYGDESYEQQVGDLIDMIEFLERPKLTDEEVLQNWNSAVAQIKSDVVKLKSGKRIGG